MEPVDYCRWIAYDRGFALFLAAVIALPSFRWLAGAVPALHGNGLAAFLLAFLVVAPVAWVVIPQSLRFEVWCTKTGIIRPYQRGTRRDFVPYARIARCEMSEERGYTVVRFTLAPSTERFFRERPMWETAISNRKREKLRAVLEAAGVRVTDRRP
jgi:hypothetical protein